MAETKGKPGTVLYVEDEESDAFFMKRAFEKAGLNEVLRLVGDGQAAIDYLAEARAGGSQGGRPMPAAVLLDLNLPRVQGFEVLRWMRQQPEYAATPVVIFSSSAKTEDKVKARELGANEFVEKPSSGLKFAAVVEGLKERWLGQLRLWG